MKFSRTIAQLFVVSCCGVLAVEAGLGVEVPGWGSKERPGEKKKKKKKLLI